jgi:hypothetical protein
VALAMVVASAHPLVLTVSHDLPVIDPFHMPAPAAGLLSRVMRRTACPPSKQEVKKRHHLPQCQRPSRKTGTSWRLLTSDVAQLCSSA